MTLRIGKNVIGDRERCLVIAEVGVNFDGNYDQAVRCIEVAAECGADAVKFQTFSAKEFVDEKVKYSYTLSNGEEIVETQFEMFQRLELPYEWHKRLKDVAVENDVMFFTSVADKNALGLAVNLQFPAIKIASEDLINIELLHEVGKQSAVPVILSTGMADELEIMQAVELIASYGCDAVLLHCVSVYPTPLENANLSRISSLREKYCSYVGYSDHTNGCEASICARVLGAMVLEKHFTLDHNLRGPDHRFSADPDELRTLVTSLRLCEQMVGNGQIDYDIIETSGRNEFRRSIVAKVDINSRQVITDDMITYKRPGNGLKPYEKDRILGKVALHQIKKGDRLMVSDVTKLE